MYILAESKSSSDCELLVLKRSDNGVEEDTKRTCQVPHIQSVSMVNEKEKHAVVITGNAYTHTHTRTQMCMRMCTCISISISICIYRVYTYIWIRVDAYRSVYRRAISGKKNIIAQNLHVYTQGDIAQMNGYV